MEHVFFIQMLHKHEMLIKTSADEHMNRLLPSTPSDVTLTEVCICCFILKCTLLFPSCCLTLVVSSASCPPASSVLQHLVPSVPWYLHSSDPSLAGPQFCPVCAAI